MRLATTRSRIEGRASTASTPAIATTTSSSMRVKPRSAGRGAMASPLSIAGAAKADAGVGQRQVAVAFLVFPGYRIRPDGVGGRSRRPRDRDLVEIVGATRGGGGAGPAILHDVQARAARDVGIGPRVEDVLLFAVLDGEHDLRSLGAVGLPVVVLVGGKGHHGEDRHHRHDDHQLDQREAAQREAAWTGIQERLSGLHTGFSRQDYKGGRDGLDGLPTKCRPTRTNGAAGAARRGIRHIFSGCCRASSRGSVKTTCSAIPSSGRTLLAPSACRRSISSFTSTSGAEAPAVTPTRGLPAIHSGFRSAALS